MRKLLMQKPIFFSLSILIFFLFDHSLRAEWDPISLPHQILVPAKGNLLENVYSAQIPTLPLSWEQSECNRYEPTSVHWKSNLVLGVKGLSFKGLLFKLPELKGQGDPLNSFAMFFHNHECYVDGSEYGWVFHEDTLPKGSFYVCEQCNLSATQKWAKWPSQSSPTFEVLEGDPIAVERALQNSGIYRYWNIQVTVTGDFKLELINPDTYEMVSVTLKKPSWLSNIYNMSGYITIVAKKQGQKTLSPPPIMHVDHVKIWQ